MRTFYKVTTLLVLGALVLGSGCSKRGPGNNGLDQDGAVVPEFLDENGIPLTSDPFDQTHQRMEGLTFAPVYFGYDSFQLAPEEVSKIEQVAAYLNENGRTVLIVEGHCDERGSNEYNLSLGEQRALSVRTYLVNLGISADRIQSRSFGEERPAVQGTGEDAWRQNRRGEFALYE
ncbi:MAG: OmpA family protein [Lentisphaerae bacterium]|nr:OmpA family protein [Lentisphaerota bacterium]